MLNPSPELLKEVRAELVRKGTSLSAFCADNGFVRQSVTFALTGQRTGKRASALALEFMRQVRSEK